MYLAKKIKCIEHFFLRKNGSTSKIVDKKELERILKVNPEKIRTQIYLFDSFIEVMMFDRIKMGSEEVLGSDLISMVSQGADKTFKSFLSTLSSATVLQQDRQVVFLFICVWILVPSYPCIHRFIAIKIQGVFVHNNPEAEAQRRHLVFYLYCY